MRRLVTLAACAAVVVMAAGAVAAAWLAERPGLTREDARRFTLEALEEAGFADVAVSPAVIARRDEPPPGLAGAATLDVWVTVATVDGADIVVWVDRSRAQATRAYVLGAGSGAEGGEAGEELLVITSEQYDILDDYTRDPVLERRVRRNVAATVAGVAAAVVAVAHARRDPT